MKKKITVQKTLSEKKQEEEREFEDEEYSKKGSESGYYFTSETDKAIARYNKTDDWMEKSRIYREEIKGAFDRLVGSIFSTFGFTHFDVPYDDVKQRVVHHLVEKMHLFREDKGKGFSYFTTIARNKLIQISKKNYNRYQDEVRIDREDFDFEVPMDQNFEDVQEMDRFFEELIEHLRSRLRVLFPSAEHQKIAEAFLDILRDRKEIETFSKKNVYMMIRENEGVSDTQKITEVRKTLQEEYERVIQSYRENGTFEVENEFFHV